MPSVLTQKKLLNSLAEIDEALTLAPVFCKVEELDAARAFVVRDVRRHKVGPSMKLQVRILEGWYVPAEVWTEI